MMESVNQFRDRQEEILPLHSESLVGSNKKSIREVRANRDGSQTRFGRRTLPTRSSFRSLFC